MNEPLYSDSDIAHKVREVAHKDLPDMRTWSVTEFQAQQLMMLVRGDYERIRASLTARMNKLEAQLDSARKWLPDSALEDEDE